MTDDLVVRLRLEARCHAYEARSANATINEIYQIVSGGRGEPGNWHGAEPVRRYVEAAEARVRELEAENRRMAERLGLLAVGFGVPDGGRYIVDWQTKIEKFKTAERAIAEAYERAAKVADDEVALCDARARSSAPGSINMFRHNTAFHSAANIAAAIRQLAQVKHEAE